MGQAYMWVGWWVLPEEASVPVWEERYSFVRASPLYVLISQVS